MNFEVIVSSKIWTKNCQDFCPTHYRAEILAIFCSCFGRNDDIINSFWNLLTFKRGERIGGKIRPNFQHSILLIWRTCHWILVMCHPLDLNWWALEFELSDFSAILWKNLQFFGLAILKSVKIYVYAKIWWQLLQIKSFWEWSGMNSHLPNNFLEPAILLLWTPTLPIY